MTGTTPGRRCVSSPRRKGKQTLLSEDARRLAERFRQHQLKQGYTERVVQEQIRQVETFQRYLALKRLTPDGMTPERLKEYMGFVSFLSEILHGRQLTQSTLFGWRVTLRHYYRWLMGEGLVSKDPARRVGSKAWRWIPKWVPESGLVEKLLTLPDEYSYTGMRDQVIFGLAATVGLTTAELANLTLDSLDPPNHRLKARHAWRTRANEERWVPLEPQVEKSLERYLKYARPALLRKSDARALFLNKDGKPIASEGVSEIFIRYCERLKIRKLNCKALRNVAALYQLRHCNRTIEDLMEIFGYKTIKHVRGYMAYLPKELRKEVDRPRYPSLMQDMDFDDVDTSDRFKGLEQLCAEAEASPSGRPSRPVSR